MSDSSFPERAPADHNSQWGRGRGQHLRGCGRAFPRGADSGRARGLVRRWRNGRAEATAFEGVSMRVGEKKRMVVFFMDTACFYRGRRKDC